MPHGRRHRSRVPDLGAQAGTFLNWREPDKARAAVEKAAPWLPGDPLMEKLRADIAAMPAE